MSESSCANQRPRPSRLAPAAVALIVVIGLLLSWWTVAQSDRRMRENLLQQARLVAKAVDVTRLATLTGTQADLNSPDYLRLKSQLAAVSEANPRCRFVYLTGRKEDGSVFFFVDNEPIGSEDESPPGQIYEEVSEEYLSVFKTGAETVEGPVTDRWGTWVTAVVPLTDPQTNELIAVLGMDIDARDWRRQVAAAAALPVGLMFGLLTMLTMGLVLLRSQGRLRESEERQSATLCSIGDGVIACDAEGRVRSLNRVAEALTGWTTTEAKGKPIEEVFRIVNAHTRVEPDNPLRHALRHGEIIELANDTLLIARDGTERQIADSCAPIRDASGQVIGAVLVFRDVSEEHQRREELAEERRRLEHILSITKTGIDIVDTEFNLQFVDSGWQKIYGDPSGRKCYEYFMGRSEPCVECGIPEALKTQQVIVTEERLPREGDRVVEVHTIPFQNAAGQWLVAEFNVDITERKRAEEALRLTQFSVDRASDGIIWTRPDASIRYANEQACRHLGYSREELLGMTVCDIDTEVDPEDWQRHWSELRTRGGVLVESRHRRKDGTIVPVEISANYLEFEGEEYNFAFIRDISERKQAEEKLRESEERFMDVLYASDDAILLIGDNTFIDCNEATARLLGYATREEFLQVHPSVLSPPEQPDGQCSFEKADEMMRLAFEKGFHRFEWIHRRANGEDFPVEVSLTPIIHEGRNLLHCVWRDITEIKQAEERLRESEERFMEMLYASDDAILLGSEGRFIDCNDATARMLGYAAREDCRNLHPVAVSPPVQPDGRCSLEKAEEMMRLAYEKGFHRFEWMHRRVNGEDFPVEVSLTSIVHEGRDLLYCVLRDITEIKRAEEALVESKKRASDQRTAIAQLALDKHIIEGDIAVAIQRITETLSHSIVAPRASVWRLSDDQRVLKCLTLYDAQTGTHSGGALLDAEPLPEYLKALTTEHRISADDAQNDPRTSALAESYLKPLGIGSLLDAGIIIGGRLVGIVSVEHVGPPRQWHADEESFVSTMAAIAAQLFMNAERKRAEVALRHSEDRFRSLFMESPVCILIHDKNTGEIIDANPATCQQYGFDSPEDLKNGVRWLDPPYSFEEALAWIHKAANQGPQQFEWRNRTLAGEPIWEQVHLSLVTINGVERVLATTIDITTRKQAEEAMAESQARLDKVVSAAQDAIIMLDSAGNISMWNQAAERIFGYSAAEALGQNLHMMLAPQRFHEAYHAGFAQFRRTGEGNVVGKVIELSALRKCGEEFPIELSLSAVQIKDEWVAVGILRDITERKKARDDLKELNTALIEALENEKRAMSELAQAAEELKVAASTDKLTGLPNRALLMDRLQNLIERHKRDESQRYAVLFLDFDGFKTVNDSLGHDAGDQLLQRIAERLKTTVRAVDSVSRAVEGVTAARLGGDEFVILLDSLGCYEDVHAVTNRLLEVLREPYTIEGHEIVSTASIGIVTGECGHEHADEVLRDADIAMYEAKAAGRGRAVKFSESMRERVVRKVSLEASLRKAIELGQFTMHYQPIVSLETQRLEGMEALVRWEHPEHGTIAPGEFIPLAEETGLIVALGDLVFGKACRQMARWRETHGRDAPPSLSVNISRRQLEAADLPERLRSIADEAGVDCASLHLEITESAIMADTEFAKSILGRLKEQGFKIDMDDFGTGHSSLASLHEFPIDVLKMDRTFVVNLSRGREFAALANAIVTLAFNLKITVIGEGVETADQLTLLQALGCQMAQGYFISRPMPAELVDDYLRRASQSRAA